MITAQATGLPYKNLADENLADEIHPEWMDKKRESNESARIKIEEASSAARR